MLSLSLIFNASSGIISPECCVKSEGLSKPSREKEESDSFFSSDSEAKKTADLLRKLHEQFRDESHKTKKDELKTRIESLIWELVEKTLSEEGKNKEIEEVRSFKKSNIKPFFLWKLHFAEVFNEKGGFDVMIANPPYLESRHPDFSDKAKDEIQSSIKTKWGENITQSVTRGSDLLIYFLLDSVRLINDKGNATFLTQNSWLDTVYGKKFQKFIIERIGLKGVIDSDFKYFDDKLGPNINTVITVFQKVQGNAKSVFARYHVNFEYETKCIDELANMSEAKNVELKLFTKEYLISSPVKWGVLLLANKTINNVIDKLISKAIHIDNIYGSCGQGLNLSKDHYFDIEKAKALGVKDTCIIPMHTSEENGIFVINKTKQCLISKTDISQKTLSNLKELDVKCIAPENSKRAKPILILPRGVSRHYCCLNEANAFSSSSVDIYLADDLKDRDKIALKLWVFLNSSLCWLIRELSGRKNLGGGLLKAEAVDLNDYPIYLDLNIAECKKVYDLLNKNKAEDTLTEIETSRHKFIDEIVFNSLGLSIGERAQIVHSLKEFISQRENKAKGA